ncbi:MAG: hypothetical protein Q8N88_02770 [Nanoarchaeota archaeon]|nr:hypothetical protein [Nanoarchaeota archaeon]
MKKVIFLILFIILALGVWQNCQAVEFKLLIDYPIIGTDKITSTSTLPELIRYIYRFALLACGLTAFVAILIGAILYVTSAGDSSKASDAKDRITSALWGILILLSSFLILNTINPDLLNLNINLPKIIGGGGDGGTTKYHCMYCCKNYCDGPYEEIIGCFAPGPTKEQCLNAAAKKCNKPKEIFIKDYPALGRGEVVKCP